MDFSFPSLSVPPGGHLVVSADLVTFAGNHPSVTNVVGNWAGFLSRSGDAVELLDDQGQRVDSVKYASEGDWALWRPMPAFPGHPEWWRGWAWSSGADAGGKSLELVNGALPNDQGQNWSASRADGGTPGASNSVASFQIVPIIHDVEHFPPVPRSGAPVTVTARITGVPLGDVQVALHHRVDGVTTWVSTSMVDDGQHGDGAVGDGVFGAILPGNPDRTIMEFYVRAALSGGGSRTWPAPTDDIGTQGANALYQVDDSVDASRQPVFRIVVTATEWAAWKNLMDSVSDGRYSDAQMNGTLILSDGQSADVRYNVGVRNRGKGTRAANPHNLHVNIPTDRPWRGLTELALNTRTVHSQVAGNAIYSLAGVPNTYGSPVQVRVNGANLAHQTPNGSVDSYQFGSYFSFQPYGSEWAKAHLPQEPDANIYKGTWYFDWVNLKNPADLRYLGEDPAAYRQAYAADGPHSSSGAYTKQSNAAQNDWSDLIQLTRVLANTPDGAFATEVEKVVDVDEWLRYLAVTALIGNMETTLGTGAGDDYSMYRGMVDSRFRILVHDMDTTLGQGDAGPDYTRSIFKAADIPALGRILKHPEFAARYYAILKEQADTTFSPERLNPLLDQLLGTWVPGATIQSMKDFAAQRRTGVLAQIPQSLTISSSLPVFSGLPKTTSPTASFAGQANAIGTRAVKVNGQAATWSAWEAKWTVNSVHLSPGINRVLAQALDADGQEIGRTGLEVWYDDGSVQSVSGNIASDTSWTAAAGPYNVTGNLTVGAGATLTIQPGTTVYMGSGVNLTVANSGRILAEGTGTQPIRLTRAPDTTASWGGISVNGSAGSPETRLSYVHIEFNNSTAIHSAGGTLFLDHLTFGTTEHQYVSLDDSSFVVQNCLFPTPTAGFEPIHGTGGIKPGGRGLFLRNYFGRPNGYNDVVDFTGGNRPGESLVQFINNVFTGASDDILDLDGTDAWVQDNIFLHAHKNGSPDSSSAVSGGNDSGHTSEVTITGNIFYDCDQVATGKQGNFYTLLNNTIVHQTKRGGLDTDAGVVNLADDGTAEGAGMYLEGNIIYDAEKLVRNHTTAAVTFTNNLMQLAWAGAGGGNRTNDPLFQYVPRLEDTQFASWEEAQILRTWFSLRAGSPAAGAGPDGNDLGGLVPLGVSVSGEPWGTTTETSATLTVGFNRTGNGMPAAGFPGGSGYVAYKWRLDGGDWSSEKPIAAPISLTALSNGPHRVEVIGKNDTGSYQNDPGLGPDAFITTSRGWTVDTNFVPPAGGLRLNEVLAANRTVAVDGAFPDLIELFNGTSATVDLGGLLLTTDAGRKAGFTFPAGTTLSAGGYLVLLADMGTNAGTVHLGFALKSSGDALYLFDASSRGAALLDSVAWGPQVVDLSIGRLADGSWGLAQPSFGALNVAQSLGDSMTLRINEWLAAPDTIFRDDFVELYNPGTLPIPLTGLFLTDNPDGWPHQHVLAPLSFIGAQGFATFIADGATNRGPDHLGFQLAAEGGMLGLLASDDQPIDVQIYGWQQVGISQGRSPNGSVNIALFSQPTPGAGNPGSSGGSQDTRTFVTPLIALTNAWNFWEGGDAGVAWRNPEFDDKAWSVGLAPLGHDSDTLPLAFNTPLTLGKMTYYFRTHFNCPTNPTGMRLRLQTYVDDGAVLWLNGQVVYRQNVSAANPAYSTAADANINNATLDGPFETALGTLHEGENVLAVEVHQQNANSGDIVFALRMDAVLTVTNTVSDGVPVLLNEVLARSLSVTNATGLAPDWVELYNPSALGVDLADCSLSDDSTTPRRFIFPAGSTVPAHGFLVVECAGGASASVTNASFKLSANGGSLYLFDSPLRGGALLDSVHYGLQLGDYSIGRLADGAGVWQLTRPTPRAANVGSPLGDASRVRLNEWMANPASGDDWFELFNPDDRPIALGGLYLTDDLNQRQQHPIAALSFIGTGTNAFQVFDADGNPGKGANHVNFKLSAGGESIGLFTGEGVPVDSVTFGAQAAGVSEGRLPDGGGGMTTFPGSASPGVGNQLRPGPKDTDGDGMPDDWEMTYFGSLARDGTGDFDEDGLTDQQEFLAGTSPSDRADALRLDTAPLSDGSPVLRFVAVSGRSYTIQYRDDLESSNWQRLTNVPPPDVTGPVQVTDSIPSRVGSRFYRLLTPATP